MNRSLPTPPPGRCMDRRRFLVVSRGLLFSASALSLCPLSLGAADIQSLDPGQLDTDTALILADTGRLLFPHDQLDDAVYLSVVRDVGRDMQNDRRTRQLVFEGSRTLMEKAGGAWLKLAVDARIAILQSMQAGVFFRYLHKRTLESLYRHPAVWRLLGYEGSSVEHGGYLHRGFDDIDWLEG